MKKMIFESDHPMGILKKLANGDDLFGDWQFYRDDKEWVNGEQVPAKVFVRSGWAYLEHNDFDAIKCSGHDSPLYYLWDEEGITGLFLQYKRTYGDKEFVESPFLDQVEGVAICSECKGTGYKFNKIIPKKFAVDEVW